MTFSIEFPTIERLERIGAPIQKQEKPTLEKDEELKHDQGLH
jgi:hypothetical protein